ncbi:MAG: hypothetical protein KIS67_05590 [Verrucomicrobiae bacterium]|nr:hypothetical protein [Verrucomicrobiae bacterium]
MGFTMPLCAQGSFQNLDFEAAEFVTIPGTFGAVVFSNALPGWTGYIGGEIQTATLPDGIPIGPPGSLPFIAIVGPPADQGLYMVSFGSAYDSTGITVPVALAQTGQIPAQVQSLEFLSLYPTTVLISGQYLPTVRLGDGPGYLDRYGVDISSFAGQLHEIRFLAGGINYLDDIRFSASPVPEPRVQMILLGGTLALFGIKRRVSDR